MNEYKTVQLLVWLGERIIILGFLEILSSPYVT